MRPGLHYTFHLRSSEKFHYRRPVRRAKCARAFLRAPDPTLKGRPAWPIFPIREARAYPAGDITERRSRGPERFDTPHLFHCLVFVLVNLLTDLLYAKADPRVFE